ncbi:titin homolog [Salvia splendens]|uniref:titin homolog n=1 Tax=Salvia splendens TaxID=180675 RepID=UPI001C25E194|nr:titin homolog [Salvia splendens]
MGKKAFATKIKPPSTRREEPPPNPQPSQPAPQAPAMVSLDAMVKFLRLQDPTRNWAAKLANFSRIGGQGSVTGAGSAVTASETSAQPTTQPPSTMPTSPTTPQEEESPTEAAPSEPSEPSPNHREAEPMDVKPIAAYYDSNPQEEGGSAAEETPVTETVHHEVARGEIDLNETAKKQGLMTDDEFQAIVDGVNQRADNTASMAEDLNLASRAVGDNEEIGVVRVPEGPAYQPGDRADESQAGDDEMQVDEDEPVTEIQEPAPAAPPVLKPRTVKRQLILKSGPVAERQKPTRVSQRCLDKWAASKAKEKDSPKKSGDEPIHATGLEDTAVSPTQSEQGEEIERVAEGLDLTPESVGPGGSENIDARVHGETTSTAQDESLLQAEEEARYQQARKRKEKAPIQRKSVTKKSRVVNTGIVITEAALRTPPSRQELSDSEYAASEESASDSDISLEDEEHGEQLLPDDHRELVHLPIERLRYRRWTVDFTDEIAEEMKLFETKKLQDTFDSMDDGNKDVKCGKVMHYPSLDELGVREQFLAYLHALGFEWLLRNGNPDICVRLAKEFFTTFRFRVTTDLDEVSLSFRLFG